MVIAMLGGTFYFFILKNEEEDGNWDQSEESNRIPNWDPDRIEFEATQNNDADKGFISAHSEWTDTKRTPFLKKKPEAKITPATVGIIKSSSSASVKTTASSSSSTVAVTPSTPSIAPSQSKPNIMVKCPKCSVKIRVKTQKRPLSINCPKCVTRFKLTGPKTISKQTSPKHNKKTSGTNSLGPVKPARITCPKCKILLKVKNSKRPLKIDCPKCSSKITLKGKSNVSEKNQKMIQSEVGSNARIMQVVCPGCNLRMKVSNPVRPLAINCPKCDSKLNLK